MLNRAQYYLQELQMVPSNFPTTALPALPEKTEADLRYDRTRHVTMKAFKLAKFPFFIRGLQCWKNSMHPASGYPMDNLVGKTVGTFFILFSIPLIAVNAAGAATAAVGATHLGVQKVERKLQGPDDYRHEFMQTIVNDLNESINLMEPEARAFYMQNPTDLAGSVAIKMAFLARRCWDDNGLQIGERRVKLKEVYDPDNKEYFSKLLEIKQAMRTLPLTASDEADWQALQEEAERMDAAEPAIALESPIHRMNESAQDFAQKLRSDPLFIQYWENRHVAG